MTGIPPGERRICVVLDIEKYSTRQRVDHLALQSQLTKVVRTAFNHAKVRWARTTRQFQGDGLLIILPQKLDEPVVLAGLMGGLCEAVADVNRVVVSSRQMRLRASFTQGIVHTGAAGFVGDAVISASRLVDSEALRAELAGHPDRDLAVIVADTLFTDVIKPGYPGLDPRQFTKVSVTNPAKGFTEQAWTHLPVERGTGVGRPPTGIRLPESTWRVARSVGAPAAAGALVAYLAAQAHHAPGGPSTPAVHDVHGTHHAGDSGDGYGYGDEYGADDPGGSGWSA